MISTILSSSDLIRLTVNAPVSLRRRRVWSGGSMLMNSPGTCGEGSVCSGMPGVGNGTFSLKKNRSSWASGSG